MLEQRFGDFQGKPFRFASGDLESAADRGEQVVRGELVRRQVDGDRQDTSPVLVPVHGGPAGVVQDPLADVDDQPALFGDGKELVGCELTLLGVVPAQQGFRADEQAGAEIAAGSTPPIRRSVGPGADRRRWPGASGGSWAGSRWTLRPKRFSVAKSVSSA